MGTVVNEDGGPSSGGRVGRVRVAVLVRGLPGTGKTTTAALVRDALPPSVRVSNDSVRYMAHPRDFSAFTVEASELACMDLALSYCESGFVPVIDGVFTDVDFLAGQVVRFARRGCRLVVISLVAEVDDLLHRNAVRDPLQRMDEERIRWLASQFEPVGVSLGIRGKMPEEVCDDVLDVIGRERGEVPSVGEGEVDLLVLRGGERAEVVAARAAVRRFAPEAVVSADVAVARLLGVDVQVEAGEVDVVRHGGKRVLVVADRRLCEVLVERALGAGVNGPLRWDAGCFSRFTLSAEGLRLEALNVSPDSVS